MAGSFSGRTIVLRIDRTPLDESATLAGDIEFLRRHRVAPIVVAPTTDAARSYVRVLNRASNVAVGLCGADAALLPASGGDGVGRVQAGILATLTSAGYVPVIEPTAFGLGGDDIALGADDVACAIAAATDAVRAIFFHTAGGVVDPASNALLAELTPSEALALADGLASDALDADLRAALRSAALGVRAGVGAAQIVDGRIAHAAIVELLTQQHLGTQIAGSVYLGAA